MVEDDNWRDSFFQKNKACGQLGSKAFSAAFEIFWALAISHYFLTGRELFKIEIVCRGCLQPRPIRDFCRQWLVRQCNGQRLIPITAKSGYLRYHAEHLQRLFLRAVKQTIPNSVLAGGWAAVRYLKSQSIIGWDADDIDIFVFRTFKDELRCFEDVSRCFKVVARCF